MASSVVLVSLGPVFVGLGWWLAVGANVPVGRLALGIVVAAVGSVIISWSRPGSGRRPTTGDMLALAGAVDDRRVPDDRAPGAGPAVADYVYRAGLRHAAMLTLVTIVAVGRQPMFGFSVQAYGWMLALGLVRSSIGHSTLNWALRHLSATFVSDFDFGRAGGLWPPRRPPSWARRFPLLVLVGGVPGPGRGYLSHPGRRQEDRKRLGGSYD